jgi:hypothetical protein
LVADLSPAYQPRDTEDKCRQRTSSEGKDLKNLHFEVQDAEGCLRASHFCGETFDIKYIVSPFIRF